MNPIAFVHSAGGREFVESVLEILGLGGAPVTSLGLELDMKGPMVAKVTLLVRDDQAVSLARVFREYEFASAKLRGERQEQYCYASQLAGGSGRGPDQGPPRGEPEAGV